jgi:hypothetical protein
MTGEPTMSAIISGWTRAEIETPKARAVNPSREEQFRCALESYIAEYRKHRAVIDKAAGGRDNGSKLWFLVRFANWSRC